LILKNGSKNRHGTNGFSLIELLIAMLIFTSALLCLLGMFPMAYRSSAQSRHVLMSTEIARKEMERLKDLSWYNLSMTMAGGQQRTTTLITVTDGKASSTTYTVTPMITTFEKDPVTNEPLIKNVKVQVKYEYGSSQKVGATLETLVARP
jgi:prepilin-type N-terminal cleavage/methylation domain-containing protein